MKRVVRSVERTARRLYMRAVVFVRACLATKRRRAACLVALAAVIVLVEALPLIKAHLFAANYDLKSVKSLVTPTSEELRKKLNFDNKRQAWVFNENAEQTLPGQTGDAYKVGGLTYSAELPLRPDAKTGLKLTDAQSKIDMSFKPEFALGDGQVKDGYAVYPITGTQSQLVYTFSQGGVKEDIILYKAPGDTAEFSYSLELPDSLEARLQKDGSVGIFGGDRTLFGNISYGSDKDKELVERARAKSKKDQLYYMIPAPEIRGDKIESVKAQFKLEDDKLTVQVSGLKDAHYPLSIDPSFVMDTSSCSWRKGGNNEDGSMSYTGCQLGRNPVSGATVGAWTQSTSAATGNLAQTLPSGIVAYNGYLYAVSSETGAGAARLVYYAPINASTGAVGQFVATTSTNADRRNAGIVIYNGYIYALGGINVNNTTEYAKINSDGSVGEWTAGTNLNVGRLIDNAAVAYNGRLYVVGGCSAQALFCTGLTNVTEYATIRSDGSLSAWTASTSAATGHLPTAVLWHTVVTGNGYLYSIGGQNTGGATQNAINYVAINSDGSLGAWASAGVALPVNLRGPVATIYNNYLYVMGGNRGGDSTTTQNTTYLAKIYADGKLGPLQQTTVFTTARSNAKATTYNGRIYIAGGQNDYGGAPTTYQDTQYTTVSTTPGNVSSFATETDTIPNANGGVNSAATVFYGGYMYLLGGNEVDSNATTNKVRYAKLNADGSTGAWAQTSTFTDARSGMAAAAYNGYMYMAGGHRHSNTTDCVDTGLGVDYCRDIQYAPINSDGTLGAWASAGGPYAGAGNTGRSGLGMAIYNGYVYVMGGNYSNNSSVSAEVDVAPINANGTVGTWVQNTTAMGAEERSNFQLAQAGPYLYIAGGRENSGSNTLATVVYATLSSNGGMSAWASAGPDFTGARAQNVAAAANGYLYVSTGESSWYNDVQYIKINMASGALSGSWTTSAVTLPTGSAASMGGIYNGYLYVAGGCQSFTLGNCNAPINTVHYAQIHNGGGGSDGVWAAGPTSSTITRYAPMTVASSGYLIIMGGCTTILVGNCSAIASSSTYAPINPDGSLGSWTTGTALPGALHSAGVAVANGYVYLVGGCSAGGCSTVQNTVSSALICTGSNSGVDGCGATGGTLGTWHTLNTISARWGTAAVAANGYLYVAGGVNGSGTNLNDVQSAQLLPTGGLGGWGVAGSGATFTTARAGHGLVSYGDYLYILGGSTGSANLSDVQVAQVQSGGQLGAWSSTTSMPATSLYGLAAAANGYMYYSGTRRGSSLTNQTMYAPIMSDGTLGSWTSTSGNSGTTALSGFAGALYNGYLYRAGGFDLGTTISNTSYYAPLQATPQIARHSMLLTTDARTLPANFFTTVTPQSSISSSVNAGVSTANDPAVILSSLGTNRGITSSTKYPLSPGNDGTKYYWLNITLDDSQSMTWGETARSNVSYLQLNYHPNPGMRLRGGKTFNNNVQQSLSTP